MNVAERPIAGRKASDKPCTRLTKAALIIAAAALSFGQTTSKKETQPTTKKAAAAAPVAAKSDTWQKSKECAAQAEKVMADRDVRAVAAGGNRADGWSNHYSLKYNRCFVSAIYFAKTVTKGGPLTSRNLIDAFERSSLANTAVGVAPEIACREEEKLAECVETARLLWKYACTIDEETTDCLKAKQFIEEHMRN
jgi:hypothetical protein